jgi:plasmid maintenance system antidote protein VapI
MNLQQRYDLCKAKSKEAKVLARIKKVQMPGPEMTAAD